jgi:hypothetical protein
MRVTGVKYELLSNFNANSQDLYESMRKLGDQVGQHGLLSGALQPTIVILPVYYWCGFHKKHPPQSGFFCWPVIGAGGNVLITGGNGKKDAVKHQGCVGHFYLSVNTPAGASLL